MNAASTRVTSSGKGPPRCRDVIAKTPNLVCDVIVEVIHSRRFVGNPSRHRRKTGCARSASNKLSHNVKFN